MTTEIDPNPALYRHLSQPSASFVFLNENISKFFAGVQKLREECRIADVTILVESPYLKGGREVAAFASYHLGNQLLKLPMLARAYGATRELHQQAIADLVAEAAENERNR